ncbi:MAG: hypothetical protein BroJett007_25310 [Chloroflexota bacterium]|jgi:hypothetical protein|nr:MAG: hypothetical protein B6D42_05045 [Anaerolineae bacterium UTCFX5]GIK29393.1 MAG: hypothetical protein BroJett007_25310 [Chloroflexota bacterium]
MKILTTHIGLIAAVLAMAGCAAFAGEDTAATLSAHNVTSAAELTTLSDTMTAEASKLVDDVSALATEAAEGAGVNAQLVATLMQIVTPTPALEGSTFDPSALTGPVEVGQRLYVSTGATTMVDSATGCVIEPRARFGPGEPRLYGTWIAYNLRAGTVFRTQWYRDDELVFTDAWTAPRDGEQLCIWFYVTPQDVEFLPGRWQIRLFADEINAATPIEFLIEGDTMEG